MTEITKGAIKYGLTVIGSSWLSAASLYRLQQILNYIQLGRWMADHKWIFQNRVSDRHGVFATVSEEIRHKRVLYLEFGVYQGASMKYWSKQLTHPESRLHGFDSFQGLPEDFDGKHKKGHFDVAGALPKIDDPRVEFFKGYFADLLPSYRPSPHEVLVIMMDADLYSSTICVLRHLRPHIKPGTFVYFDDLSRVEHEAKAFDEFMRESGLRFMPVCADRSLNCVFFECVDGDVRKGEMNELPVFHASAPTHCG